MKETLGSLQEMLKAANQYLEAEKSFTDHLQTIGKNASQYGSQHPDIGMLGVWGFRVVNTE